MFSFILVNSLDGMNGWLSFQLNIVNLRITTPKMAGPYTNVTKQQCLWIDD